MKGEEKPHDSRNGGNRFDASRGVGIVFDHGSVAADIRVYYYRPDGNASLGVNLGNTENNRPGRPRHDDPPVVLTLRLPASLRDSVDQFAQMHGVSRNMAGRRLLAMALEPASGYNPLIGEYDD